MIKDNEALIVSIEKSIRRANMKNIGYPDFLLHMEGMSTRKTRVFFNSLASELQPFHYLEIGVWKGATSCNTIFNNAVNATLIDDFSQFNYLSFDSSKLKQETAEEQVKKNLIFTIENDINRKSKVLFYKKDCFKFDLSLIEEPIDLYFYDGLHTEDAQYKAFSYYNSILSDVYIAIVDDFDDENIKKSTEKAFNDLNHKIIFKKHLKGNGDKPYDSNFYWNGLGVYLLNK